MLWSLLVAVLVLGCVLGDVQGQESKDRRRGPVSEKEAIYTPRDAAYVVNYYGQCGGTEAYCNPASGVCKDAQYPGAACPMGFACKRKEKAYWQCVPDTTYHTAAPGATWIGPYGPCGGAPRPDIGYFTTDSAGRFEDVSCPDGYSCRSGPEDGFLCRPNPMAYAEQEIESLELDIGDIALNLRPSLQISSASEPAPGPAPREILDFQFSAAGSPVDVLLNVTQLESWIERFGRKYLLPSVPPPEIVPTLAPSPAYDEADKISSHLGPLPDVPPPSANVSPDFPPSLSPYPAPSMAPTNVPPPADPVNSAPSPAPAPTQGWDVDGPAIKYKSAPALAIKDGKLILKESKKPAELHGLNWFGFENGQTMVDGLYSTFQDVSDLDQVGDFATTVFRQQALGFNAVRLPFRFADLNIHGPKTFAHKCRTSSREEIMGNLTNPTAPYAAIDWTTMAAEFPEPIAPLLDGSDVQNTGSCNLYLPNDSTLSRLLWIVQYYIGNGFYVVLDYHAGQGEIETDRKIVAHPSLLRRNWMKLLAALQSLSSWKRGELQGRLIFDILNEPDAFSLKWHNVSSNPKGESEDSRIVSAWNFIYLETAQALLDSEDSLLFMLSGADQFNQAGSSWGMGFGIKSQIFNGNEGFGSALLALQAFAGYVNLKNHTIIAPHCYGYQITEWTTGNTKASHPSLASTYHDNFAYLNTVGVPITGDEHGAPGRENFTFPIIVGEFGNSFNSVYSNSNPQQSDDLTDKWIHDFAEFANNLDQSDAKKYPHGDIKSSFWWTWNANTQPPTGLVSTDPEGRIAAPGRLEIQWTKINNLTDVLRNNPYIASDAAVSTGGGWGLRPWYLPKLST